MVADGTVSVLTFSDSDCSVSIVGNNYLVSEIKYDSNPSPTGSSNREIKVEYTIEYKLIKEASIFTQLGGGDFKIDFCLSFILLSGPGGQPISAIDTEVAVEVKWDDAFGEEILVGPTDRDEYLAEELYTVEGFLCDDDNERITYRTPKAQGSVTKICVKPTDRALEDGIYMRRIDSFGFRREGPDGSDGDWITQGAVGNGQALPLTQLTCIRGSDLCHFSTVLNANFYYAPGTVLGFGEAWLQFGNGNSRRLQMKIEAEMERGIETSRSLAQLEGGFAGSSYLDLDLFAISSQNLTHNAEAYECDQWHRPVADLKPKRSGSSVRVCVRPDAEARTMGVKMLGIESWNFTRDGFSQGAIDYGGLPSANGLTIVSCIPGSPVCSFRTEFIREFYDSFGAVQGFGTVLLQYAFQKDGNSAIQRRLQSRAPIALGRNMQEEMEENFDSAQGMAGSSSVRMETLVTEEIQQGCEFDHKVTEWWIDQDINDRYMYISILVGALVGICALLLCCWLLPPFFYKNEEDEPEKQNVAVNVNVNSEHHEEHHSNVRSSKSLSRRLLHGADGSTDLDSSSSKDGVIRDKRQLCTVPHGDEGCWPTDDDVCFDQNSHPGTKKFKRLLKQVAKEMDEAYSPSVYRVIKKKLRATGTRFYVGKDPYFEPEKPDLVDRIGVAYTDAWSAISSNDEDNVTTKSKRSIKRTSSRRSLS